MLEQAAHDFSLDLARSYVIGDSVRDLEAAHNAGAKAVLVLTGYGKDTLEALKSKASDIRAHFVAPDLLTAARWITQDIKVQHENPHH